MTKTTTTDLLGLDVDVYFNLHRKCWSIRDRKTRLVVGHASELILSDVTFRVSAAGNARVRREGKKNVHAFARGTLLNAGSMLIPNDNSVAVEYNPYKFTTFVTKKHKRPVHSAKTAWFGPRTLFAELDTDATSGKITA